MEIEQKCKTKLKRKFSTEERRSYCEDYSSSGMTQIAFCKLRGISKSALTQWRKELHPQEVIQFSPVSLTTSKNRIAPDGMSIKVSIRLSNQMELSMVINEASLISLIQRLNHATAIIR